jgi:glutathione S-transferase
VPTLVDGDQVVREGAAILMYLAEKHKSPLLPAEGKARTAALQALMFANATLHPAYGRAFFVMKSEIEEADKAKLLASSISKINDLWQDVERQLEHQPYLAGSTPTLGDIIVTVIANWSLPQPITIGPRAKKLFQTMTARPAYRKALDAEQVEYKAAA